MSKSPCTPEAEATIGLLHNYREGSSSSAPLIVLVHGRCGTRDVMWTFERILPPFCWIVSPQAPVADREGGFSWWPVTKEDREPNAFETAAASVGNFVGAAERFYGLTPQLRIAIGFSQGAALLSVLSHTAAGEEFAGIGLLAGFVIEDESRALSVRKFFVGHGTQDQVVPQAKAERSIEYLKRRGAFVESAFDDVGHKVGSNATRGLKEWCGGIVG